MATNQQQKIPKFCMSIKHFPNNWIRFSWPSQENLKTFYFIYVASWLALSHPTFLKITENFHILIELPCTVRNNSTARCWIIILFEQRQSISAFVLQKEFNKFA